MNVIQGLNLKTAKVCHYRLTTDISLVYTLLSMNTDREFTIRISSGTEKREVRPKLLF
jgi:hypothetical protein